MDYNIDFREEYRHGSASWATRADIEQAGLLNPRGPQVGFFGGHPLHLNSDSPMLTVAGAGSGKCRDVLAFALCQLHVERLFVLDLRGELGAISIHNFAFKGINAYFWNPMGLAGLPHHRSNPLDVLTLEGGRLIADAQMIAASFVIFSGGGEGKYFEQRARDWLANLMVHLVEMHGVVDFAMLSRLVNSIEGDTESWLNETERMLESKFPSLRRTVGEMLAKQADAPKEFGAIMGTLYASLSFLDDPALLASLRILNSRSRHYALRTNPLACSSMCRMSMWVSGRRCCAAFSQARSSTSHASRARRASQC